MPRRRARRSALPPALKLAIRDFEAWRRTRTKRTIPEDLWIRAMDLATEHGVHRCARTLRLDYATLKRRLKARKPGAGDGSTERATFVEVVPPQQASGSCVVEFENTRGAKMRVELQGSATRELADVVSSLWSAGS